MSKSILYFVIYMTFCKVSAQTVISFQDIGFRDKTFRPVVFVSDKKVVLKCERYTDSLYLRTLDGKQYTVARNIMMDSCFKKRHMKSIVSYCKSLKIDSTSGWFLRVRVFSCNKQSYIFNLGAKDACEVLRLAIISTNSPEVKLYLTEWNDMFNSRR